MRFEAEGIVLDFVQGIFGGPLQIRYYGLIIVAAMLVAAFIAARLARRDRRDPEHVWGALTWAIIPGIILARLWFVLFPPSSITAGCATEAASDICRNTGWFLQNIGDLTNGPLAIWSGGLSIFGAVLGGFIGVYIYARRNKLALGPWLDIAAVALPLGQAIGRWANFVNQELYGTVTSLPWGISIPIAKRVAPFTSNVEFPVDTTRFHPLFLYESLLCLLLFIVLLNLFLRQRNRLIPGDIFLGYLVGYSIIRFLLEFLRVDVALVGSINWSQVVTALTAIGAALFFLYRHRPGAPVVARQPDPEPVPKAPKAAAG